MFRELFVYFTEAFCALHYFFGIKIFAALRLRISCTLRVYWRKETQGRKACFLTPNEAAERNRQPRFFEMERYFLFFICSQTVCLSF